MEDRLVARRAVEAQAGKGEIVKLDAKFEGEIRKVKDGSIVPDDEYVVFLAKDNAFAEVIHQYRTVCIQKGCDEEQIAAVDRMILRLEKWRRDHPERLKDPDASGERLLC
jgi:hypothetical protein